MSKTWSHDYRAFLKTQVKSLPAIIEEGILPVQSRMIIGGEENVGKTIFVTQMALDIASGKPFLGLFDVPNPRRVMLWEAEVAEALYQQRLAKSSKRYSRHISSGYLSLNGPELLLDTAEGKKELFKAIQNFKAEVVIIDPTYKFHTADENSGKELKNFLKVFDEALIEFGISVILTHHKRKPSITSSGKIVRSGLSDFRGHSIFTGWADSRLIMSKGTDDVTLDMELRHSTGKPPRVILTLDRKVALFTAQIPGNQPTTTEAIIVSLVTGCTTKYGELVDKVVAQSGVSARHAKRAISSCRAKGLIELGSQGYSCGTTWKTEEEEIDIEVVDDDED